MWDDNTFFLFPLFWPARCLILHLAPRGSRVALSFFIPVELVLADSEDLYSTQCQPLLVFDVWDTSLDMWDEALHCAYLGGRPFWLLYFFLNGYLGLRCVRRICVYVSERMAHKVCFSRFTCLPYIPCLFSSYLDRYEMNERLR